MGARKLDSAIVAQDLFEDVWETLGTRPEQALQKAILTKDGFLCAYIRYYDRVNDTFRVEIPVQGTCQNFSRMEISEKFVGLIPLDYLNFTKLKFTDASGVEKIQPISAIPSSIFNVWYHYILKKEPLKTRPVEETTLFQRRILLAIWMRNNPDYKLKFDFEIN